MNSSVKKKDGDSNTISFASFIMSLSSQALMQMGEFPAPEGVSVEKDLEAARQTIDIIAMLLEKTRGNLEDSEEKLLEDMHHELRMRFVSKRS